MAAVREDGFGVVQKASSVQCQSVEALHDFRIYIVGFSLDGEPRNRLRADIVGTSYRAQRNAANSIRVAVTMHVGWVGTA
jgi:hypothetical protein